MKKSAYLLLIIFTLTFAFTFYSCNKGGSSEPDPQTNSLGQIFVNPNALIVNQLNNLVIRVVVPFGVKVDSFVTLSKVDNSGNVISNIGQLFDDGNLTTNADEIKGDNIFTGKVNITETSTGTLYLAGFGNVDGRKIRSEIATIQVFGDLTTSMFNTLINTQTGALTPLNTALAGNPNNAENASNQVKTWIESQPGVSSVEKSGSTSMIINYTSGLQGGLIISVANSSGTVKTRGGVSGDPRTEKPAIPLKSQTVGTPVDRFSYTSVLYKPKALPANVVGNRNVLIYAPFENAFSPWNEGDEIIARLNQSTCQGYNVTYLQNSSADIAALNNLTNYGFVVLATHGSQGKSFGTGEVVDTNKQIYKTSYKAMLQAKKLAIWTNIVIGSNGAGVIRANVYAVTDLFISALSGTFPNSIILNNSCESTMNPNLQNAFIGKGAKTYYGYTKVVNSDFCVTIADSLAKRLAKDNLNSGQAFFNATDPGSPFAVFQIKGANDMVFSTSLINGDFETGTLEGWSKSGDGRVISQLGSVTPTQGGAMGIISSGLGFTTASGQISQCVLIPQNASKLKLKWNFFSEEFLEYINSQFQDYFRIKLKLQNGTEVTLYSRTIDQFAADFGATKEKAGNLISVSPGIVFDRGGVYMTGWQSSEFDVTPYRGQVVTIIMLIGDVGDSIYDSATLLDEVKIE